MSRANSKVKRGLGYIRPSIQLSVPTEIDIFEPIRYNPVNIQERATSFTPPLNYTCQVPYLEKGSTSRLLIEIYPHKTSALSSSSSTPLPNSFFPLCLVVTILVNLLALQNIRRIVSAAIWYVQRYHQPTHISRLEFFCSTLALPGLQNTLEPVNPKIAFHLVSIPALNLMLTRKKVFLRLQF
jgi:hypothetical protein